MCNRFTVSREAYDIMILLGVDPADIMAWPSRYNVAPSQTIACLRILPTGLKQWCGVRWGLIPSWSVDGAPIMNARSESVTEKVSFRDAVKYRRCLIPADGFIEWETIDRIKQPHWFRRKSLQPFCFAGIWEPHSPVSQQPEDTAAILTTSANADVSVMHDRMPVMLDLDGCQRWLDPTRNWDDLKDLCQPLPAGSLDHHPVDRRLNSPKGEDPNWLLPQVPPPRQGTLF